MAGINILDLVEATEVNEANDYLAIVDKSDTTQDASGSTKKITVKNLLSGLLDFFYPVGTIYETTSSDLDTVAKMNAYFGGTWEVYGAGRVVVGYNSSETEFNATGKTGGTKTHTLTVAEMPSHGHNIDSIAKTYEWLAPSLALNYQYTNQSLVQSATSNTGGGQAHNNLQPYIVVYRYRRIS